VDAKSESLFLTILCVGAGAFLGALARWALSEAFNAKLALLPLGTLLANGIGALLAGFVMGFLLSRPALSPYVRLFVMVGFLGALTTFSTFSVENVQMLMQGAYARSFLHAASHLFGSLCLCWFGFFLWRGLAKFL